MLHQKFSVFITPKIHDICANLFMENTIYTNLSPEEFKLKAQEENTVILDVRTSAECAEGIIEGALIELDMYNGEFEEKFKNLDQSKTYLIYCRSGVRSVHACEAMAAEGFTNLYNLRTGILGY
jgi:rhodanese-related sulfurtransferase